MDSNKYSFPYEAYDIQLDLMNVLYKVLEERKIGLFESPTGTGKSLSIICGAFTWMRDYKLKRVQDGKNRIVELIEKIKLVEEEEKKTDEWIRLQQDKMEYVKEKDNVKKALEKLEIVDKRNEELKLKKMKMSINKRNHYKNNAKKIKNDCDNALDVDEFEDEDIVNYESDCDGDNALEELDKSDDKLVTPKIYYCSRTHSQLSQFVGEIKKTCFSKSGEPLRLVTLGSRANLCVNASVVKLGNTNIINDRCLELNGTAKNKCEMYKQPLIRELGDEILADVLDIEEVAQIGRQSKACPYYGTRYSIAEAEIVVLPYNILLHKQTRKSFGIELKDSVVIIDEAHNLCETINAIHSVEIKAGQILDAHSLLTEYMTKYHKRLNAKNLMNLKQIIFILNQFIKYFQGMSNDGHETYLTINFLIKLKIENINFYQVLKYCEKSQLARKLFGFAKKREFAKKNESSVESKPKGTVAFLAMMKAKGSKVKVSEVVAPIEVEDSKKSSSNEVQSSSPMYAIIEFLRAITNPSADGRVLANKDKTSLKNSTIKYCLLNSSAHFKELIEECRSIILAGGTMQPFSEYVDQIFKPLSVESDRIEVFSCGHVIPDANLLAIALGEGPTGHSLSYTFQTRSSLQMIEETGRTISNICNIIPGGIVCFFPSYDYLDKYYSHWNKAGIIKGIEAKHKRIFREPQKANEVSNVLTEYTRTIKLNCGTQNNRGAILLSVVGGKMSEGINFSDDLGRCIIMIGLPYANKSSPELQERIKYFNSINKNAGQAYYENLCMKSVNQSIGRSIRHKDDYAVIVLLDGRYTNRQNVQNNLPKWISSKLSVHQKFSTSFGEIRKFFATKTTQISN